MQSKRKKLNKKALPLSLALLLAIGVAGAGWAYLQEGTNNKPGVSESDSNLTSSDGIKSKLPTLQKSSRDGGVIDTSGDTSNQSSEGITSESGKLTVYRPTSKELLKSGSSVSGTSKGKIVSYRLIDDNAGVIAQGSLNVINGRFSGKFSFDSQGTMGRFDIFHTLEDGREIDIVEIPVRFK